MFNELENTIDDLNSVVLQLISEKEELKQQLEKCQNELYELRKYLNIQHFYEDNISHDYPDGNEN